MRFNLTQASYRVLEQASRLRVQRGIAAISPAKLLWALFEEDECRAAQWLCEAHLSLELFLNDFGIQTLHSPISAPAFPTGDYGISAGQYIPPPPYASSEIDAARTGNNSPPVGNPFPEQPPLDETEHEHQDETDKRLQEDRESPEKPMYSLYSSRQQERRSTSSSRLQFYLDDQWINVGLLTLDLEDALETVALRFVRQDSRQPISLTNNVLLNGVKNIVWGSVSVTLSTEHLLLAVVLDNSDVGRWLQDHGFDATELYQRIDSGGEEGRTADGSNETDTALPYEDNAQHSEIALPSSSAVPDRSSVPYRLFDAAANRGREAIRVIEDYVRFMLSDADLTQRLKTLRHQFQEVLQQFPMLQRLEARNTSDDVGTEITADGEYLRSTVGDLVSANFSRLQESLRSLEEFSKLTDGNTAQRFEHLRYASYTLHKDVVMKDVKRLPVGVSDRSLKGILDQARLYALVDIGADEATFEQFVTEIIVGGVDIIQLRDKSADDRTLLERSRLLKRCIEKSERGVLFIMNDRPDLALLAGADGVHVGQEEIPVPLLRQIVGSLLIGVSTHSMEQAQQAVLEGADYIGAGPVFESSTKEFTQFAGLSYLKEVSAGIALPTFAIGGITEERMPEILQTGVRRMAIGAALSAAENPQKTTKRLKEIIVGGYAPAPDAF